ncbi:outer membrane lipoprotein carrier protein LolA [candidate division KSB1 bacterium]|nr:outer membrane lipoprotein carrier protein LolA [candidate division KSB1 bacterium]
MRKIFYISLFSFLFSLFLPINSPAFTKKGKDIIKEVKKKYDGLTSLQADFVQTFKWELVGEMQSVKGTIYLMAGNHYRIETEDQVVVTDGATVWTYSKRNQQVIVDLLDKSEESSLPKDLLFKYSEDYTPILLGEVMFDDRKTYQLNLIPKDEDAFIKSMKIWVDASNWFTTKIEQVDINDNVNTYILRNIRENIELDPTIFKFEIPEDAEVVDLRESE